MAFATIHFEHPTNGKMREAPVGFSWTMLFFGFFPPLFRSDWKWAIITMLVSFVTFGLSWFLFPFFYNKIHAKELIKEGFKVKSITRGDSDIIGSKIGVSLPMLKAES
ncbi:hypothetical protein KAR91_19800 [Candidatus Pacearchaeota archaeon]|nr:hypothetical protein [Candidatus Pacearchaeota archaeon]